MKRNNQKRGFTIVELVIVIAVIAILAAVLIPTYANLVKKANEAAALSDAKNLVTEMLANILSGGDDAADLLVFTEKGDEIYVHGYDASEGSFVSYSLGTFAKNGKTFDEAVNAALTDMAGKTAIKDDEVGSDDWRDPDKVKTMAESLGSSGNVRVFANYTITNPNMFSNGKDGSGNKNIILASDASAFGDGTTFVTGFLSSNLQKDASVILTDNVVLSNSIRLPFEGTTLLLDLNGKSLTVSDINLLNPSKVVITDSVGTGKIYFTSNNGIQIGGGGKGASVVLNGGTLYTLNKYNKEGSAVTLVAPNSSFVMNGGKIVVDKECSGAPNGTMAVRMSSSNTTFIMNGGEIEKTKGSYAAIQASGDGNTTGTKIEINGGSIKSNTVAIYHPQGGSLTVNDGYIEGITALYIKSGTIALNGGEMKATGEEKTDYKYDGNGCVTTGDAVVIDACGYPGGNPNVNITGGKYTVTASDANGIAHYKYNGNSATITAASGITVYEKAV